MPRGDGIDIGGSVQNAAVVVGDHNVVSVRVEIHQSQTLSQRAPTTAVQGPNPYRGLLAFQPGDGDVFCGRAEATQRLVDAFHRLHAPRAAGPRLLAVLGASGSGKSSLVLAGLLPALERRLPPGVEGLRVAVMTPGARPLENLARALRTVSAPGGESLASLADALPDARTKPLVLVVDQFEEVYTLCASSAERDAFIADLLRATAADSSRTSVVITLRIDFFGVTETHPALAAAISERQVLVRAMNDAELREAIEEPARRAGRPLDESTVALLMEGTRGREGALPLVQFALTCIWDGIARGADPGTTLQKIGGVGGALAARAQGILDRLTPAEQAIARRVFVALVQLGDGTSQDTRRRVAVTELAAEGEDPARVRAVVDEFARPEARLVTLSRGEGEEAVETAEVTHEALFRHWHALAGWLDRDREDIQLTRRVQASAEHWKRADRAEGLLWRPPDLDLLVRLRERRSGELTALQAAFCAASVSSEDERRRAKLEEQKRLERQARNRTFVAIGAGVAAVAMAVVTLLAVRAQRSASVAAEEARNFAVFAAASLGDPTARVAILREVREPVPAGWEQAAMDASSQPASEKIIESVLAFTRDGRKVLTASRDNTARLWNTDGSGRPVVLAGFADAFSVALSPDGAKVFVRSTGGAARVWNTDGTGPPIVLPGRLNSSSLAHVFSPDGKKMLLEAEDGTARVWSADSADPPVLLERGSRAMSLLAFSPDGKRVLIGSDDWTAHVWNADGSGKPIELKGFTEGACSGAFSPDGTKIAAGSFDHTALVWSADGSQSIVLKGHAERVLQVVFSEDGKKVLTGSADRTARVWNADGTGEPVVLEGHADILLAVAFSPDGKKVITASRDQTARVWNADGSGEPIVLGGHTEPVSDVAFIADGKQALTRSWDGTLRVWNLDRRNPVVLEASASPYAVTSVAFSRDGKRVLTGGIDGTARVWNADDGGQPIVFDVHYIAVWSAAFSPDPDGTRVLAGYEDHTARVWSADGREPIVLRGHGSAVNSVAFSPDGTRVLTGSYDHTARVWSADGRGQPTVLEGHADGVIAVAFSPDGARVLTGSRDKTARLWSLNEGGPPIVLAGHADAVNALAFNRDGTKVLTGSKDGTARVWNADRSGQFSELRGHMGPISAVAFSPDGTKVLTGSDDKTARVWNTDGSQSIELGGHYFAVRSVAFSPDGKKVVTGAADKTARVWNVDGRGEPLELKGHTFHVSSVVFSPDGTKVLTGSDDTTARVWSLDVRPVLWRQTGYCLPATRRERLLGETPERAREGEERCRALVDRCRPSLDACRQAVREAFGAPGGPDRVPAVDGRSTEL
jgi:WD40 repeat protein